MTLALKTNLAADLRALGRKDEAAPLHAQAMRCLFDSLGTTHPLYRNAQAGRRADCDLAPMPL